MGNDDALSNNESFVLLEVEKEHYVNIHPTTGQIILTEKEGDQLIIAAFPCNVIFFHLPLSLDPKI